MKSPYLTIGSRELTGPDSEAGAAVGGRAAPAPPASSLDAPLSNRASNRCISEPFQLLSCHVDSLDVSFVGELSCFYEWELEELRGSARSKEGGVRAEAQLQAAGHVFQVSDKGARFFPFVLSDDRFFIKLARSGNTSLPFASCQIRNAYLLHVGPQDALKDLAQVLSRLGSVTGSETVSRIDLAVDFVTDQPMDGWGREAWVTKLRRRDAHADGDDFTGWTIGQKTILQLGLYDKTLEIREKSHKEYMYEVWEKSGWAPWDSVWRAEGRFRRPILAQFGLKTLDEVLEARGGLWRYLTETSIRLTVPNLVDKTRARWPNHPIWDRLSSVDWGTPTGGLVRAYKGYGAPQDKWLAWQYVSLLSAVMARESLLEPGAAQKRLRDIAFGFLQTREIATGLTPEEALIEKAREKGRRYGTLLNVSGRPAPSLARIAAGRTYREASDGA